MAKKILKAFAGLLTCGALLTGCAFQSNLGAGDERYFYKYVHIESTTNTVFHDEVIEWNFTVHQTMVEIHTKNYGWICLNDNFVLYNSEKCPLCNR